MRKQSGRWACFFEQMGDQNVHLSEGFSPSYEHSPHLLEKTSYPEGASDPFARWHSARLAAAVTKQDMNPSTGSGRTDLNEQYWPHS
jgi:hypothetical protein